MQFDYFSDWNFEIWILKNQKGGPKGSFLTVFLDLRLYLYKKFDIKVVVCVCGDTSHNTMEQESPKNGSFLEIGKFLSFWKNPKILLFFAGCPQCLGRVRLSFFLPSERSEARRGAEQSEARRKFGKFGAQKCPLDYSAASFFWKNGTTFHQITAHFDLQYPLSAHIIALFCPSRHSVLGRGVIITIMGLQWGPLEAIIDHTRNQG